MLSPSTKAPATAPTPVLCIACELALGARLRQWLGDKSRYRLIFWESSDSFALGPTQPPGVILLGSGAGLGSLPALAAQWPAAAVVVLLEPAQEDDAIAWLSRGADDYWVNARCSGVRLAHTVQRVVTQAQTLDCRVAARTAELRKAKDAAEAANGLNRRLIADLGHDLRNPLNTILGFSNRLSRQANLSAEHREGLDIIHHSGEHLLARINGMLGLANKSAVAPPLEAQRRVVALAPDQPPCRILIVEDDWINRVLLQTLLAPLGFELQGATQGEEAILIWADWQPHLIWIAITGLDSYETTRCLRRVEQQQLQPETPAELFVATKIIALLASAEEDGVKALAAGCNDVVAKPLQPDLMLHKIAEHLAVEYTYATEVSPVGPVGLRPTDSTY